MAAGCTIAADALRHLRRSALQRVAHEWLDAATLARKLRTDGPLHAEYFNAETVRALDAQVWGQGFEAPLFSDEVEVVSQRLVGEKHLKLTLRHAGMLREAIWFGRIEPLPERVTAGLPVEPGRIQRAAARADGGRRHRLSDLKPPAAHGLHPVAT